MQTRDFGVSNKRAYEAPSMEMVGAVVESGFELSNNQEPSPWEDMFSYKY